MFNMAALGLMFFTLMTEVMGSNISSNPFDPKGLIISGLDQSVEVYVPSTGQHCQLPDLPFPTFFHSMEETVVCGGYYNRTSCLTLTSAGWETTTDLLEERYEHVSWASPGGGIILMGGAGSLRTAEKIQEDGTSTYSFDLKYSTRGACPVNLGSSVLLTGGTETPTTVSQYNEAGWLRNLPTLLQERFYHGCSYYTNIEGTKTYLVSGGRYISASDQILSSTELLMETASAWVLTGELPSPRTGLRGTNIDNKIIMTGGNDDSYNDEILEFDPLTGQWEMVDRMIRGRSIHAVSVVNFESGLCV